MTAALDVRELATMDELGEAEAALAAIWRTESDRPPLGREVLRALSHAGCYVAGAFESGGGGRDRLVGASAGFLGGTNGDVHLHSHITGVLPSAQGRHIGLALKEHQREWCLKRGIDVVTWTFDPLVRRNAWFNLHRLGAEIVSFEHDFYGSMSDGVNAGDVSDRCVVRWDLHRAGSRPPLAPGAGDVVVAVPEDFESLRSSDPAAARAARADFRAALAGGGALAGMTADRSYVLRRA